ncbi:MAG TPA: 2-C-methyl-D-erythritol 2,4-cyclodiphosphate synthase [Candidatus Polarisedimenticolia bacterium]|nr:2-C-methyl-D-erythritol 2,4-cyclodiphosphate synthase [Candidatus Polarisedimenticolia bacterium]
MSRRPGPAKGGPPRIGLGIDRHPFEAGRRLVLGGIIIPDADGLRGHSDADVLTHAVCDALLGALGLPDLGTRFPSTSEQWRDKKSLLFLDDIMQELWQRRYVVGNLDAVLLAERPPLLPHLPSMRSLLAKRLHCEPERVSIKPKRGEGLGFIGRGEGIEAHAAVMLVKGTPPKRVDPVAERRRRSAR